MPKSTALNVTQNIKTPGASFANADGTTAKTLVVASANDSVVKAIVATSNDTATVNLKVILNDGTTDRIIGTVAIPANSGTNGSITAVDLLSASLMPGLPLDQNGKRVLPLQGTYTLKIAPLVAVTATKQVDIIAIVEDY